MSLCLNPNCSAVNPDGNKFCEKCCSKLFLQERYQAIKLIGQG
jgi:serine/threonine-protein kinase